jgi:hypothetical protein
LQIFAKLSVLVFIGGDEREEPVEVEPDAEFRPSTMQAGDGTSSLRRLRFRNQWYEVVWETTPPVEGGQKKIKSIKARNRKNGDPSLVTLEDGTVFQNPVVKGVDSLHLKCERPATDARW